MIKRPHTGVILFILLLITTVVSQAQKLPGTQPGSVLLPNNFKVDGRSAEWNGRYEAYNKSTEIFYTIANNDTRLYLVVHCVKPEIITKIIRGGITLNINALNTRQSDNNIAMTYPLLKPTDSFFVGKDIPFTDSLKAQQHHDTIMHILNKRFIGLSKFIGVAGIKDIGDTIVSIYNENDIKAAALFDNKITFTAEISLPLRYLPPTILKTGKLSYRIQLNGIAPKYSSIVVSGKGKFLILMGSDGRAIAATPNTAQNAPLMYVTDLKGEYTLAK